MANIQSVKLFENQVRQKEFGTSRRMLISALNMLGCMLMTVDGSTPLHGWLMMCIGFVIVGLWLIASASKTGEGHSIARDIRS